MDQLKNSSLRDLTPEEKWKYVDFFRKLEKLIFIVLCDRNIYV